MHHGLLMAAHTQRSDVCIGLQGSGLILACRETVCKDHKQLGKSHPGCRIGFVTRTLLATDTDNLIVIFSTVQKYHV